MNRSTLINIFALLVALAMAPQASAADCDGLYDPFAYAASSDVMNNLQGDAKLVSLDSDARAREVRRQLTGNWNVVSEHNNEVVDLEWHFHADGTFDIITGPDRYHSTLGGHWHLSEDNMHVELSFVHDIEPDNVYARDVLTIHTMDYEDLTFSGSTVNKLTGADEENRIMYCEKQTSL